jgi:hypothetical protein
MNKDHVLSDHARTDHPFTQSWFAIVIQILTALTLLGYVLYVWLR